MNFMIYIYYINIILNFNLFGVPASVFRGRLTDVNVSAKIGRFGSELSLGSLAGHAKSVVRDGRAPNGQSMVGLLGMAWDGLGWLGMGGWTTSETWGFPKSHGGSPADDGLFDMFNIKMEHPMDDLPLFQETSIEISLTLWMCTKYGSAKIAIYLFSWMT